MASAGPQTVTTRALLDLVAGEVGHPVAIRSVPKLAVRGLALINPMMRELAEMGYEFEAPFSWTQEIPVHVRGGWHSLPSAIAATVAWYRTRPGTS